MKAQYAANDDDYFITLSHVSSEMISDRHPSISCRGSYAFVENGGYVTCQASSDHVSGAFERFLNEKYGFTSTETEIARLLCAGYSPSVIAERRCRSIHTVRTHVKRLMSKLEVSRMQELILCLANYFRDADSASVRFSPQQS